MMAESATVAYIEPSVLRWARESAGYTTRGAADAIGVDRWYLEMVETGNEWLSLDEAEKAAEVFGRPLAALFVPTPPEEEPQEVQFRRLPGTPEPPWGPEVQLTARRVTERQQIALEIYEALEDTPPWPKAAQRFLNVPRDSLPNVARDALGVSREDQQENWPKDDFAPFRAWRASVEKLGILVMQEGPVPVEKMRGFASIEPAAVPAILINNKDDPRARAFTVLHELGHVILAARGEQVGQQTERWCESFAGRVLMPGPWLRDEWDASLADNSLGRVRDIARAFRVTPRAAAVRASHVGVLPRKEAGVLIGHMQSRWQEREEEEQQTGGNYHFNQINKFGPGYLRLIFAALDNQAVTLPTTSALLEGVKVKRFERLRHELEGR
jgi:Zn-dependent peptidase ImmA (M78 family)/DNA-binding XRE family transcriptional regulator